VRDARFFDYRFRELAQLGLLRCSTATKREEMTFRCGGYDRTPVAQPFSPGLYACGLYNQE